MAQRHSVYDTDTHFTINPITRALHNESHTKTSIIQNDHNSERITFEIPRYVEGHDMSKCNVVQVHYLNIDAQTKMRSEGVYDVTDKQISPDSEEVVILSWLISQNATQYVGSLNFLVRFSCVEDDGTLLYAWNTAIHTSISVSSGIFNSNAVVEDNTDILEQWRSQLESMKVVKIEQTQFGNSDGDDNIWTAFFGDGSTSDLVVKNGSRGETSLVGSVETVEGNPLHFSLTTKEESEALPIKNKKNLLEIVLDGASFYSPVYRANAYGYGETLSVPIDEEDGFVLEDGTEILVSPKGSGRSDPDGGKATLQIGDTDEYEVDNGETGFGEYGYNYWKRNDVLRFRFDEPNQKWLLTENLTQGKVYPAAWKTFTLGYSTAYADKVFEHGKTYQATVPIKNVGTMEITFTVPSVYSSEVLLPRITKMVYGTFPSTYFDFRLYYSSETGAYGLACQKHDENGYADYLPDGVCRYRQIK